MTINRNLSKLAEGANSSGVLAVTNGGTGITSLTAGYIPYGNGTSAFSSSSSLYFDGTNLGIGTTSPYSNAAFATLGIGGSGSAKTGLISLVTAAGTDSAHIDVYNSQLRISTNGTTNPVVFYTGGSVTEAMRIDSSGNVGIGTSSPGAKLDINPGSSGGFMQVYNPANTNTARLRAANSQSAIDIAQDGTGGYIEQIGAYPIRLYTNSSERVRISAAGGFSVGTTADPGAGAIYATGNITAYYSSDRTLKENIQDVPNALSIVSAIGSKTFDWTDAYIASKGGEDGYFVQKSDFGVVAQDVQAVFPQAVRTRQDGTLAVDYEKLATLAFGAIKELAKRVEALEAK